ncbi:cysteine dioxygenase [Pseudacidovorax sp. RU35E]|uniref:cysteine dioxygenase family protein n=1 Tax=Pseudacidovorax sp. RU35E TaxID=1907403 RepID=UPI00095653DA|nr:cysteine dioxygenase [Pseudacidovorax sp. RU35E]SIQ54018.1 Predicted metal-dependent enzyme of the double-stranded beta helix superfamily [Pseudacidovorax sp. RU35E]
MSAVRAESRLLEFVRGMTRLVDTQGPDEPRLLAGAAPLMKTLVAQDDWLPDAMAQPHPTYYQQHLLYGDPLDRFSLVSFVWGPGQQTPVHDHTVWGIVAMLRGRESSQRFTRDAEGRMTAKGEAQVLVPGELEILSPTEGDVHQVCNALPDRVSISIHLYGGNIGRIARHVYVPGTTEVKPFVSGYSNALVPNLWAGATA